MTSLASKTAYLTVAGGQSYVPVIGVSTAQVTVLHADIPSSALGDALRSLPARSALQYGAEPVNLHSRQVFVLANGPS